MVSPQARRDQVETLVERGHSARCACGLIGVARSMIGYKSIRAEKDAPTIAAMRSFSAQYPRYGYRRIRIFLGREGHQMGPERAHRLWKCAGLQPGWAMCRRRLM